MTTETHQDNEPWAYWRNKGLSEEEIEKALEMFTIKWKEAEKSEDDGHGVLGFSLKAILFGDISLVRDLNLIKKIDKIIRPKSSN